MTKVGRLIMDLIGGLIATAAIIIGVFVATGHALHDWDSIDPAAQVKIGENAHSIAEGLTYSGIALGGFSLLMTFFAVFMIFKQDSHATLTTAIWIIAIVAVGFVLYGIVKHGDWQDIAETVKSSMN